MAAAGVVGALPDRDLRPHRPAPFRARPDAGRGQVTRLRVGVVGAGMIAQVEHIPNLLALREKFELVGVADPSQTVRAAIAERHGVAGCPDARSAARGAPGRVVVAVPDALHADTVLAGLDAGLHVFCEKPLCFTGRGGRPRSPAAGTPPAASSRSAT